MRTTQRSMAWTTLVALAASLGLPAGPALAQPRSRSYVPNTYADFPYNQGSLFYRPLGSNASRRGGAGYRRSYAPRSYYVPRGGYTVPPRTYYYVPAPGYYRPY